MASNAPAIKPIAQAGTVIMKVSSMNCHPRRPLDTPVTMAMPISSRRPAIAAQRISASSTSPPPISVAGNALRAVEAAESSFAMDCLYAVSDGEVISYVLVSSLAFFTSLPKVL